MFPPVDFTGIEKGIRCATFQIAEVENDQEDTGDMISATTHEI